MNKELVANLQFQAAAQVSPLLEDKDWYRVYNEKLAELIVRECIDLVEGYTKPRTYGTHYDAVEQIKHHFGVEK